ncbi:DivIVA domain-containing protein [Micromonospora sp. NPDC092111]|uniref:DivIVA domain-containing protein n=1 Tax=Micromonospora sp. NPDC092111 TaxID=3364289 RepID=UPI00382479E3
MRDFFRRRIPGGRRPVQVSIERRVAVPRRLLPWQVRERRFRPAPLGRRGLDPQEVREFLDQVAEELATVYDALGQSRRETSRIRIALCHLQAKRTHARNEREWDR